MFVSKQIFQSLDNLSKNFNHNYSIVIDFLFYIFDRFSYEQKKSILKQCPLMKDKRADVKDNAENSGQVSVSEEIQITIHPLLEERLINLILECEKLQTISDVIEFLIFVSNLIDKDLFSDLIIQYSIDSIEFSNFNYFDPTKPDNYQNPDPLHVITNIPDKTEFILN